MLSHNKFFLKIDYRIFIKKFVHIKKEEIVFCGQKDDNVRS